MRLEQEQVWQLQSYEKRTQPQVDGGKKCNLVPEFDDRTAEALARL